MPELIDLSLSAKEREKQRKLLEKKQARIASSWFIWIAFERPLKENQPEYLKSLYDTVRRISQEIVYADTVEGRNIRWDEARNRILDFDLIERTAKRFGKSHATIQGDIGRVASHNSWLARINRNGDYGILNNIIKESTKNSKINVPVIAMPVAPPIVMTAIEIKRKVVQLNTAFQKTQKEFLGDEPPRARTVMFSFVSEMDLMSTNHPKKKPRRNWRREIGV
ncbi:MAG: hypothetical protein AAB484_02955 [Patescibacteria group bacterium]|mgnify:CR=1 FL=1